MTSLNRLTKRLARWQRYYRRTARPTEILAAGHMRAMYRIGREVDRRENLR